MNSNIRLYSNRDIDELPISKDPLFKCAYEYTVPMIKNGTRHYIDNVNTDLRLLVYGKICLPVTVNTSEWDNSYVCSPYTHYISYAKEELVQLPIKSLRILFRSVLDWMGTFLKKRDFNRVVIVNNWMLSTNLYPAISVEELGVITEYLKKHFPTYAIMFRSVNDIQHQAMLSGFRKLRYLLIASRQVYICDTKYPDKLSTHARKHINADKQKLDRYNNVIILNKLTEVTAQRMMQLYNMLYLDKYSYNNPQFNDRYMHHVSETGVISFTGLTRDGLLVGLAGTFFFGTTISAPILGYDTALPQREALYRRLSSITYQKAKSVSAVFNNSSGASGFKLNRGFIPALEYSAVYVSHLPRTQQYGWYSIKYLVNVIAAPIIKFFKL